MEPRYLGDGVYAKSDDQYIWLTTGSHLDEEATNRIALEPEVFEALAAYQRDVQKAKGADGE
jgi:hypothetical protein